MGNFLQGLHDSLWGVEDLRVLIVGLDASGKTTITYKLKLGEVVTTIPTIGFNVETIFYQDLSMTIWDVGGQDKIAPLWRYYYQSTNVVIFVVDSNDRERIDDSSGFSFNAQHALNNLLEEPELKDCTYLIWANKQDLPNCMSVDEIAKRLNILKHKKKFGNKINIIGCCAISGDGLYEGLDWVRQIDKPQIEEKPKIVEIEMEQTIANSKQVNDMEHDSSSHGF
eukprot:139085_1